MHVTWAEDRALLGSNPSAVPGAKIGDRGEPVSSHLPSVLRDWHEREKSRGLGQSPSLSPTSQLGFLEGLEGVGVGFHAAEAAPDSHGTGWALAFFPLPTTKLGNH